MPALRAALLRSAPSAPGPTEGKRVVEVMRPARIADHLFRTVVIRPNGRTMHDMYRFRVKAPAQSRGPYTYYELLATIPAAQAFRPLNQGGCPMVKP